MIMESECSLLYETGISGVAKVGGLQGLGPTNHGVVMPHP